ncbi:hypothetical protein [Thioalkalivibrio sp. HK1]|uniref:hypothetical protein n=1 Tax=Thioalkalivibrio sp. HK1 TaxID=1469245 RepID=UPI0012DC8AB4|nr:hypothetical protein [Thioalkalivibrio sp. HK1]
MYELLQSRSLRHIMIRQMPAFLIAFVVAERFYKLGSFALECVAFLATWWVVDALFHLFGGRTGAGKSQRPEGST